MTTITIDRATVEQALKVLKFCTPKPRPTDDDYAEQGWKEHNAAITALRAALAQQAEPTGKQPLQVESVAAVAENATTQQRVVEAPPSDYRRGYWDGFNIGKREGRIEAEDAQQQAEPDHETRAELAEQQVVQLAEERDHYRNLWQKAQEQAEPLNLSDPAVRKRLASQWGYVPAAAQAEPVEEPVAYFGSAYVNENGVHITTVLGPVAIPQDAKLYTAPPQRTMVPLTEEEIPAMAKKAWKPSVYYDAEALLGTDGLVALVRAVEQASWEKNHGQA